MTDALNHDRNMNTNSSSRTRISTARRRKTWAVLLAASALALVGLNLLPASASPQAGTGHAARVRLGTYDSRAVAIAYARSEAFGRTISELKRKHADAVAAGNKELAEELSGKGEAQQIRLHLQGFSTAPVEDCLDAVRDSLPGVAQQKNVVAITRLADYHDASVELVDVTNEIAALFKPDAKTLEIIVELRKQEPLAIEVVAKIPAKD